MKNKYFFVMLFSCFSTFAQDARIFQNTWYLTNLIENGVNNYPPNNLPDLNFTSSTNFQGHGGCTNGIAGNPVFENNNTNFSSSSFAITLAICNIPILQNYESLYFNFFHENFSAGTKYFTYTITQNVSDRTLIINSAFNKQAIYSSIQLANKQFEKLELSLYPNPVTDFLEIKLDNEILANATVLIYNELGAICKTEILNVESSKIDVKNLSNGVYFVKINIDDETVTRKFVKM